MLIINSPTSSAFLKPFISVMNKENRVRQIGDVNTEIHQLAVIFVRYLTL